MELKEQINDLDDSLFEGISPITEKVVKMYLLKNGVRAQDIEHNVPIEDCPFNVSNRHNVDFKLTSKGNETLYIEVKGQMTYSEVNKLLFLLKYTNKHFYILQLTEYDWIEPYNQTHHGTKEAKSKQDFERQFEELLSFYKREKTAKQMASLSKKRLLTSSMRHPN
ncbi:MAG: hypothetical protein MJY90_01555 [Bacteroidaceae bacterium]|nr:hypothetical protein [Bacteroidaceae bacterium]